MQNQNGPYANYQNRYDGSTTNNHQTIKNPTTQFHKGTEMNDRDRIDDMLATAKWLTDGFNVFVRETSHQSLYNDVLRILNETHHAARDIFNLMFEKGWYSLKSEQPYQVAKNYQKFSGYQNQFPTQSQHQQGNMFPPLDY